jgi:hypothetical protein
VLAYVSLYDQRGGGVETAFKEDKQGLGITKRSKKRFAAQQVVALLGALAHNVLTWAKRWMLPFMILPKNWTGPYVKEAEGTEPKGSTTYGETANGNRARSGATATAA